MALLVYVDDLVLTGNDNELCAQFKAYLHQCFRIKDLGPLKYFLGIEVARTSKALFCVNENIPLKLLTSVDSLEPNLQTLLWRLITRWD